MGDEDPMPSLARSRAILTTRSSPRADHRNGWASIHDGLGALPRGGGGRRRLPASTATVGQRGNQCDDARALMSFEEHVSLTLDGAVVAQNVTAHLVDDLSGDVTEDAKGRGVQFAFDRSSYEIDLSDDNADDFREAFSNYLAAGRKVSARSSRGASTSSASKGRSNPEELAKIREWAAANGHEVAARGRISQQVRGAYDAAN